MGFSSGIHLLQLEVSLIMDEDYTHLWVPGQMFVDCYGGLDWFSVLVVVDFPPISMILLALMS